jgi:hypothetical protein
MNIICGECGSEMISREIAPCLYCGGNPEELDEFRQGEHRYYIFQLFGGDVLCDFCDVDMPSVDPTYLGFPANFKWDPAFDLEPWTPVEHPQIRIELACSKCNNTLRKQNFAINNARKNDLKLPGKYWPFL